jgi:hypothetical protein
VIAVSISISNAEYKDADRNTRPGRIDIDHHNKIRRALTTVR